MSWLKAIEEPFKDVACEAEDRRAAGVPCGNVQQAVGVRMRPCLRLGFTHSRSWPSRYGLHDFPDTSLICIAVRFRTGLPCARAERLTQTFEARD